MLKWNNIQASDTPSTIVDRNGIPPLYPSAICERLRISKHTVEIYTLAPAYHLTVEGDWPAAQEYYQLCFGSPQKMYLITPPCWIHTDTRRLGTRWLKHRTFPMPPTVKFDKRVTDQPRSYIRCWHLRHDILFWIFHKIAVLERMWVGGVHPISWGQFWTHFRVGHPCEKASIIDNLHILRSPDRPLGKSMNRTLLRKVRTGH